MMKIFIVMMIFGGEKERKTKIDTLKEYRITFIFKPQSYYGNLSFDELKDKLERKSAVRVMEKSNTLITVFLERYKLIDANFKIEADKIKLIADIETTEKKSKIEEVIDNDEEIMFDREELHIYSYRVKKL